ncbi:hypothetical protein YC2023_089722 [Brassica napus]
MEGLGSVRCSAVSLGPMERVVPTGRVVTIMALEPNAKLTAPTAPTLSSLNQGSQLVTHHSLSHCLASLCSFMDDVTLNLYDDDDDDYLSGNDMMDPSEDGHDSVQDDSTNAAGNRPSELLAELL